MGGRTVVLCKRNASKKAALHYTKKIAIAHKLLEILMHFLKYKVNVIFTYSTEGLNETIIPAYKL